MKVARWLQIGFASLSLVSFGASAQEADQVEAQLMERAARGAASYDRPPYYSYNPQRDPKETAASTVAIVGHILLEAYRVGRNAGFLDHARTAGDSLLAAADLNGNGTYGWGRFWAKSEGTPSMPGDGSNTTFAMGCALDRNKAYDDEFYDNARVGHFLLALSEITGNRRYLDAAQRMIDDTWEFGEATADGGFYYFKTVGQCDRGWHVRNVNMLMAVPIGLLAKMTGEERYRQRFEAMMRTEQSELRRTVNGQAAPNLGYYGIDTMRRHPTQGTYVARAQTTDLGKPIECNPKTGSGQSCTAHLGLEARAIDIAIRSTGRQDLASDADIELLMQGHAKRDSQVCGDAKSAASNGTYCAAYYCALRHRIAGFGQRCRERTADRRSLTPDVLLGLFWGAVARYP